MCSLPDFSFVIAVEEMLSGAPLCENKLKGGFPGGAWDVGQEVKHSGHVTDHQLGKHHHQTLTTNNRCYHTHLKVASRLLKDDSFACYLTSRTGMKKRFLLKSKEMGHV